METKKFAVIGHPIGHTMSPFIHTRLFELQASKPNIQSLTLLPKILNMNLKIPFQNLTDLTLQFRISRHHSVSWRNWRKGRDVRQCEHGFKQNGISKGYTTDPDGFLKALDAAGIMLNGRIVIIGCGGVARTMAYEVVLKNSPSSLP